MFWNLEVPKVNASEAMAERVIIRSACYLCEGTIEFPAELTNQVIPCPHCGREVKLFVATKPAARWYMFFRDKPWNTKQKLLTGVAFAVFFFTLFNAPWEITYRFSDQSPQVARIETGSVFDPLPLSSQYVTGHRLLLTPLVLGWLGLVVAYGSLFLILRTREQPLFSPRVWRVIKWSCASVAFALLLAVGVAALLEATRRQRAAKEQKREAVQREQASQPSFERFLEPVEGVFSFHGLVSAVNEPRKSLTVGSQIFHVTTNTKILRNGRSATLHAAVGGDEINGQYRIASGGQLEAITVSLTAHAEELRP